MLRHIVFTALIGIIFTSDAFAQTRFLQAIPDVPMMGAMREIEGADLVFDKAGGRVVEESVTARGIDEKAVQNFYGETLPALGWHRESATRFVRNDEQLIVNLDKLRSEEIIRFSLSPADP